LSSAIVSFQNRPHNALLAPSLCRSLCCMRFQIGIAG
jgi:hypothetical protein